MNGANGACLHTSQRRRAQPCAVIRGCKVAALALGVDAGPMSGFDGAKIDAAFFAGTAIKRNFLANLAYGDPGGPFPRSPCFDFDDIAGIE